MHKWLPPLCLFLALANVIAGFAIWSREAPEAGVELHAARVSGDEQYEQALERRLQRRQTGRTILLGCLFGGSVLLIVAAFATMRP